MLKLLKVGFHFHKNGGGGQSWWRHDFVSWASWEKLHFLGAKISLIMCLLNARILNLVLNEFKRLLCEAP